MSFGLSASTISLIGAVAPSVIGAVTSGGSAQSAAGTQQQGAQQAGQITQQQYANTERRIDPYSVNGLNASNLLSRLLGTGNNPGRQSLYDQRFQELDDRHRAQYGIGFNESGDEANKALRLRELNAAVDQEFSALPSTESADSQFGSLLKKYTGEDLATDPGYQFRQSEGQKGIERSAAGRGGLFSGQAGKELERFSQGLASTEFQNAFNRDLAGKQQTYNMLSGQAGQGLAAEGTLANAGAGAAGRQAEYVTQGANADAAGQIGIGNAVNTGIGNYQNYNLLNSLFNKQANSGASSAYDWRNTGNGYDA